MSFVTVVRTAKRPGRCQTERLIAWLCTLDGNVALFSHGQFSRALAAQWIGLSVVESQHFSLATASLSILGFDPAHPEVRAIELWNAIPGLLMSSP